MSLSFTEFAQTAENYKNVSKSDFLFLEKPHGWSTHSPSADNVHHVGLHEWAQTLAHSHSQESKFQVCHRLDRETSGAILFAKNIEAARSLGEKFEKHEVLKSYFFVTKAQSQKSQYEFSSFIEKLGEKFVSTNKTPNAFTQFEKVNSVGGYELWRANPKSGKPHQIRLHAQSLGIPVLGDHTHGGAHFSRMMLHSHSLNFEIQNEKLHFDSDLPYVFENLETLRNLELANWISASERRFWWLKNAQKLTNHQFLTQTDTWRWLHTETKNLRAEQLGENVFFNWYSDQFPDKSQIQNVEAFYDFLLQLAQKLNLANKNNQFFLQLRSDRQKSPREFGEIVSSPQFPKRWKIKENDLHYELRLDSGLSTGLFLDQRNNRAWVRDHSQGKKVLNLFSYTGGFSLCAARGGATQVVSVDVSQNFLDWSKQNFQINDIPIAPHEFRKIDSLEYLAWAKKKSLKFDLIICDPPSFARVDKKIFKVDKALQDLVSLLSSVLNPGGQILFCTNFENLDSRGFLRALSAATAALDIGPAEFRILREDFELPHQEPLMKCFLIEKMERSHSKNSR